MIRFLDKLMRRIKNFWHSKVIAPSMRKRMKNCGCNVAIGKDADMTCEHMNVGSNVYFGPRITVLSTRADVIIGNDVMFGPGVTIITGNHRIDMVGRTMFSITDAEKRPEDDQDVIIENDVWIGANATILKGVTIGMGSVVAAGAVVTKSVPAYSIVAGVPAKVVGARFSEEEITEHLKIMNPQNDNCVGHKKG